MPGLTSPGFAGAEYLAPKAAKHQYSVCRPFGPKTSEFSCSGAFDTGRVCVRPSALNPNSATSKLTLRVEKEPILLDRLFNDFGLAVGRFSGQRRRSGELESV